MATRFHLQMSADVVVEARNVSKRFTRGLRGALRHGAADIGREFLPWRRPQENLRPGEFWALKDISFELRRGDSLAIIGANGAGKSTLLKLLSGLLRPDHGSIRVRGRLRAMIELGAAFNPVLSGRENIFVQGALYGYKRGELAQQMEAIIDFAGLEEFIDMPLQQYSDGMRARLGFSLAINLDPDVLLVDEVLAVGDIAFQNKCLNHIRQYLSGGGTLVFVGHASHQVQSACLRGLVLTRGVAAYSGGVVEALDFYLRTLQNGSATVDQSIVQNATPTGSGGCRITGVESRSGANGGLVSTGGSLDLAVSYESDKDIAAISVGFTISTQEGVAVAGSVVSVPVKLSIGRGTLSVNLPTVPLFPGTYHMKVFLFDWAISYAVATFGWEEAPHVLTVEFPPHAFTNGSALAGFNVYLPADWSSSDSGETR